MPEDTDLAKRRDRDQEAARGAPIRGYRRAQRKPEVCRNDVEAASSHTTSPLYQYDAAVGMAVTRRGNEAESLMSW